MSRLSNLPSLRFFFTGQLSEGMETKLTRYMEQGIIIRSILQNIKNLVRTNMEEYKSSLLRVQAMRICCLFFLFLLRAADEQIAMLTNSIEDKMISIPT